MVARAVESWWNGHWGSIAKERVRLRVDGDEWQVEHEGPYEAYALFPELTEPEARERLARLTAGAEWRRLDQPSQRD